jgi:hypothetical protein
LIARALRLLALAIAAVGVIDPAITLTASSRPDVAIIAGATALDSALAERVTRDLARKFNVVPAGFEGAAATVFVGDRLELGAARVHGPVFAVRPGHDAPAVAITAVHAPSNAPLDGRISITTDVHITGGRGGTLVLALRAAGIVVDRVSREITRDDATQTVALELTPTRTGVIPYSIAASIGGAQEPALVDGIVDVHTSRWSVLFYDARPSWQSTFVRRALERDPRFIVTSRVTTSRALSRNTGAPPQELSQLDALAPFDVVVVGAPDALSESAVDGLAELLRKRAGSIVLLFDRRTPGTVDRLMDVSWTGGSAASPLVLQSGTPENGALRVTEAMWPVRLPTGSSVLAHTPPASDSSTRPIVWSTVVGGGRLIVSGALNAWQFRSPEFDRFWQSVVGQIAAASPRPVDVRVAQPLLHPGEATDVSVTVRAAALAPVAGSGPVHADVTALLRLPDGALPIRLWPEGPGRLRGSLRAPARAGTYHLVVSGNGTGPSETAVVVVPAARRAAPDQSDLRRAYVASHGGRIIAESRLTDLSELLERATRPERRREERHPMRAFWWMFPFALALSAEWWIRRRSGLR